MNRQKREFAICKMQESAKERETNCNKYAAGGAAKIRQDVSTRSGAAKIPGRNKGRSRK